MTFRGLPSSWVFPKEAKTRGSTYSFVHLGDFISQSTWDSQHGLAIQRLLIYYCKKRMRALLRRAAGCLAHATHQVTCGSTLIEVPAQEGTYAYYGRCSPPGGQTAPVSVATHLLGNLSRHHQLPYRQGMIRLHRNARLNEEQLRNQGLNMLQAACRPYSLATSTQHGPR